MIVKIPIELLSNFQGNPERAWRDFGAQAGASISRFFKRLDAVKKAINYDLKNPFDERNVMIQGYEPQHRSYRRFIHIDLGLKKDAAGFSVGYCPRFVMIKRYDENEKKDIPARAPFCTIEMLGRIVADKGKEIIFSDVRHLVFAVEAVGAPVGLVTYDGFQSVDSIQILREKGFPTGRLSIDRTASKVLVDYQKEEYVRYESTKSQYLAAWNCLKTCMYESRLEMPYHTYYTKEAEQAELYTPVSEPGRKTRGAEKVDHPAHGTIDLLQSLVGTIFNIHNNEIEYEQLPATEKERKEALQGGKEAKGRDRIAPEPDEEGVIYGRMVEGEGVEP